MPKIGATDIPQGIKIKGWFSERGSYKLHTSGPLKDKKTISVVLMAEIPEVPGKTFDMVQDMITIIGKQALETCHKHIKEIGKFE